MGLFDKVQISLEYVRLKKMEERLKKRWNEINVDIDAPEDCHEMCKELKKILDNKK